MIVVQSLLFWGQTNAGLPLHEDTDLPYGLTGTPLVCRQVSRHDLVDSIERASRSRIIYVTTNKACSNLHPRLLPDLEVGYVFARYDYLQALTASSILIFPRAFYG